MDRDQMKLAEELLFSGKQKKSFVKGLYFNKIYTQNLFPYPYPQEEVLEETKIFLRKLQVICEEKIDGNSIDRNMDIPQEVIDSLGKIGVLGMTIPKEYGGLGLSQYAYCRACEMIASYCGSTAVFVNAHQSVGLKAILLFGTEEQKKKWLPPLANGSQLAAFALTEPNAGSDAASIETKAIYDPEKKVYKIIGRKQWITNGAISNVLTVMAKVDVQTEEGVQQKITAFLVTPDTPGFKVLDAALEKVGVRATKTANLQFDHVEVSEENVLGPIGGGLRVCLTVLDYGRTTFGATCTGVAKFLLKKAIPYSKERKQFGESLKNFPLIKQKITLMTTLTYAMEATTYMTAGLIDAKEEDIMLEAAILKVFASEALWLIAYETMQIYGGKSFFTSEPLERIMRDARLNMIGEGANEVLRIFIAAVGLREAGVELKEFAKSLKSPFKNLSQIFLFIQHLILRFRLKRIPIKSSSVKEESQDLARRIRQFAKVVLRTLIKHKEEIIDKQFILNRITTAAISLYTSIAVMSKLDSDLKLNHAHSADLKIGKMYLHLAKRMFDRSLKGIQSNIDDEIETLSDLITEEYAKVHVLHPLSDQIQ